jgi:hypothetical protein
MHASQFCLEGLPASLLKSKFSAKASSPSATAPPSSLADGGLDAAEAAGLGSGALGWGGDTFAGAGTAAGLGSAHLGWGGDTFAGRGTAAGLGSGALGWGGDTFAVAGVAVALGSGGAAAAGGLGGSANAASMGDVAFGSLVAVAPFPSLECSSLSGVKTRLRGNGVIKDALAAGCALSDFSWVI